MRPPLPAPRHGGFIFLRLGCFLQLITLACLVGGARMIYLGVKNREPVTVTVKNYLEHRPEADWLHLTQAHVDFAECASGGFLGIVNELYIPVRPVGQDRSEPVRILLKTKNRTLTQMMMQVSLAKGDPAKMDKVLKENPLLVSGLSEATGLVQSGLDNDSKARSKLDTLDMNLAKDYVIIDGDDAPSLAAGVIFLIIGLVLCWVIFVKRLPARVSMFSRDLTPRPPPLPPQ